MAIVSLTIMLVAHRSIRTREGFHLINASDEDLRKELDTGKLTVLPSRDLNGAAIALFTARQHFPPLSTHQLVLKGLVYQLDAALESVETQRNGLVFIYDMTDSKYSNFDYELSIKILTMLKGGYPARLKKVLIVTAPLWFKAPFKILRLFVREKLRDRVFTVNKSQLPNHIPRDSIPEHLGGGLKINHKAWLQVCLLVAANQNPDMDSYFISRGLHGSLRQTSMSSVSSDTDNNVVFSDFESEGSRETVSEKHNHEEREKEMHDALFLNSDTEKEVAVEKEDSQHFNYKRSGLTEASRKRSSDSSPSDSYPGDVPPPPLPRKKRPPSGPNILEDSIHLPDSGGMTLEELINHIKTLRKSGLFQEYAKIKMEAPAGTFNTSKAKHNLAKNRYTDVLCFDHSRVILPTTDDDPSTDYINANFVDGYKQKNAYISTQGPLPKTSGDFWRMVWDQQTRVVVMTTKAVERGRMKCGQYWPNEEETDDQYSEFLVCNRAIEQYRDYTVTSLILHNTKTEESREVIHIQFTGWPDYGIPHSASAFLDFLFSVRKYQSECTKVMGSAWKGHPMGPPIVVHCSAGIGRTGTFITMDINLHRLHDEGVVDIHGTVCRIRSQRAFSIQMPDQYVFCHLAIIEYAQAEGLLLNEVDLAGFESDSDSEG
ncbi:tyrosine-protein phosphatase non-receptor type 9-like isoform X2 [Liolophura sinensis]|uniref:tyrosine-protein phosphatase non-receptor type 9-like isoform X2 n=1 Tax=Liolophura sinensis TaxID=3198878 RepID=UPI0031591570